MNSIKEFQRLSGELTKIAECRSKNPEMFVKGAPCEEAYRQIVQDLEEVLPKANKLIMDSESLVAKLFGF